MKKLSIAFGLMLVALSIDAAPTKIKDSTHSGTGRELLDNITPNALAGGSANNGAWTGYEGLEGQQIGPISRGGWNGQQCTGYARVVGGRPYIYMAYSGANLGWMQTEYAQSNTCSAYLSPSGLTINVASIRNIDTNMCCGGSMRIRTRKSLSYGSGAVLWKR